MKRIPAAAMLCLLAVLAGCSKVPAGNVGVIVNLYGSEKGVETREVGTGRYWVGVNEELYLFPTFTQTETWGGEEAISFQTVEGMKVGGAVGITYSVSPDKVTTLFQKYRAGIDEITNKFLRNMVRDAFNDAASKLPVESVYGAGKADLLLAVEKRVRDQVAPIGINIERIYYASDLVLPPQVTQSLNAKIQATQMAEQRRNEVAQAKAEADKERARAQGEADAKLTLATADAKAIEIRAQALRSNPDVVTSTLSRNGTASCPPTWPAAPRCPSSASASSHPRPGASDGATGDPMKRATVVTELPASTSRDMDKFVVRLPDGLRAEVEAEAKRDERSMNSLIVVALREYLHGQRRKHALLDALTAAAGDR